MNYSWAQNGARWLGLAPSAPGTHGKEGGLEPPAPPWPPHTWFSSEGLETQTCVFAKSNWNPYSHPSTPEGTLSVCAHPSIPCWERHQHQDINAGQTHSRKSTRAYFCKPRARAASVQWGKAVMSNAGMDGEGSNSSQLMIDRVSEWKTLLKVMNSIPNPRLYSQGENLRPREGRVLYQAAQQIK